MELGGTVDGGPGLHGIMAPLMVDCLQACSFAVSTAVGAVGVVVAKRFRMIQRALVMGMGALIRRVSDGYKEGLVYEEEGRITAHEVVVKKVY
eukprot:jgi/Picre1/29238/NNA_004630.t1